ncbi:MAG: pyrroline-5-carboxylate reductase [Rickettsiales bacterium]|nr:pyrroline-5-carboxylate reductase [Pseudomonadota bacterium]MDA0967029.1 pyrroline-5-carboxylate reductase [Pseudomonadota bacterium]MDG4542485.1 pyrroline-5-carboxylate reductase [Rickettsiales bacterium]MDG4544989.1 pyrroline-5-carboxylate reductase [Rickettsiales bacterium]MDG4547112.1 pyrroline-5-carboxylate reductase [Rickettsiales bacterium]
MISQNIILVGCGKMGSALFGGLLPNLESKSQALIISPSGKGSDFGVNLVNSASQIPDDFKPEIILLAVKPQIIGNVLEEYKKYTDGNTLFISVAAGKTIKFFEDKLGKQTPIVRAMPNLPSLIKLGATTICANDIVNETQKSITTSLFESVGMAIWLDNESQMNAATGLAGSGPAYVFHFIECLIEAGIKEGLPQDTATELAISTVLGSAVMANNSDNSVTQLKEQVISPNGTTQAGIDALSKDGSLQKLIQNTVSAATRRSKELAE